ncbi:unnamed protein product [Mytilus edulis]|uniref:Ig-like domain-containing protein n=1 Tax=Mytilus edulis TaxID=6550 RepID=A0A8S3RBK7_MYTED|nr:unnamed protein product [Mytilus edulis]
MLVKYFGGLKVEYSDEIHGVSLNRKCRSVMKCINDKKENIYNILRVLIILHFCVVSNGQGCQGKPQVVASCPESPYVWIKHAKVLCTVSDNYHCLITENHRDDEPSIIECCMKPQNITRGNYYHISKHEKHKPKLQDTYRIPVLNSQCDKFCPMEYIVNITGHMPRYNLNKNELQEIECQEDYYMPTQFSSNRYRDHDVQHCKYRKSNCNMEGMKICNHGSTTTDRSCYCDYKELYVPDLSLDPGEHCFPLKDNECSLRKDCDRTYQELNMRSNHNLTAIVISVMVLVGACLILIIGVLCYLRRNKKTFHNMYFDMWHYAALCEFKLVLHVLYAALCEFKLVLHVLKLQDSFPSCSVTQPLQFYLVDGDGPNICCPFGPVHHTNIKAGTYCSGNQNQILNQCEINMPLLVKNIKVSKEKYTELYGSEVELKVQIPEEVDLFFWLFNGDVLNISNSTKYRPVSASQPSLKIYYLHHADVGSYVCKVVYEPESENEEEDSVLSPMIEVELKEPVFSLEHSKSIEVNFGAEALIHCDISNCPEKCETYWEKINETDEIKELPTSDIEQDKYKCDSTKDLSTLTIKNTDKDDAACYRYCIRSFSSEYEFRFKSHRKKDLCIKW